MGYKIYFKGDQCQVSFKNDKCILDWVNQAPTPSKHRAEIEAYLRSMSEPTLTDNGNDTITLTFTPMSQQMATWIVESKTTFFNVVRQHLGHRRSREHGRYPQSSSTLLQYFPYSWNYVSMNDDPCLINNIDAFNVRTLNVSELTSGRITRDISWLYDLRYSNSFGRTRDEVGDFMLEFYLGFVYYDEFNVPTIYKMGYLELEASNWW